MLYHLFGPREPWGPGVVVLWSALQQAVPGEETVQHRLAPLLRLHTVLWNQDDIMFM